MKAKEWKNLMTGVLQNTLQCTQLRLYGNGARIEFLDKLASHGQITDAALYDQFGEMGRLVVFPRQGGSMPRVELWLQLESAAKFGLAAETKELRTRWEDGMRRIYGGRIGHIFQIRTRFGRLDELAKRIIQQ